MFYAGLVLQSQAGKRKRHSFIIKKRAWPALCPCCLSSLVLNHKQNMVIPILFCALCRASASAK